MRPSVEQIVADHLLAAEELRQEIGNDPAKAREFLISAGILKPSDEKPAARATVAEPANREPRT